MAFEALPSTGAGSAEAGRVVRASWGELVRLNFNDHEDRIQDLEAISAAVWRGDWDEATAYNAGDIVQHDGSSWRAEDDIAVTSPPDEPGDASPTSWMLVAAAAGVGTLALDDLSDVAIGSPLADGDVLTYDGSASPPGWVNAQPAGSGAPVLVVPVAGDTQVASDTTPNNDAELLFAAVANAIYVIDMMVCFTSSTDSTIDVNLAFSIPAGATITWSVQAYPASATSIDTGRQYTRYRAVTTTGAGVITTATIDASPVFINAVVRMSSTAGDVAFQWAQGNSSLTNLVRKEDSFLRYQRFS